MSSGTVAEACKRTDNLAVAHKALIYGVHGILEREGTLKLSCLDLEIVILLPLTEEVYHTGRAAKGGGVALKLHLCLPIELVEDAAIERETRQA